MHRYVGIIVVTPFLWGFAAVAFGQCPDGTPPPCPGTPRPSPYSVAVLVFENRNRDTNLTALADGLADQIATNLTQLERLQVVSSSAVRAALDAGVREPRRIGEQLGTRYVVDGSILGGPTGLRITVQLVDAPTRRVRWSASYQRPPGDLFDLIASVSDSVAVALVGAMAPAERTAFEARLTAAPEQLETVPVVIDSTCGQPHYPQILQMAGLEGTVTFVFVVDTTGSIDPNTVVTIQRSHLLFVAPARAATLSCRYRPARSHGRVVRFGAMRTVGFALPPR